MELQEVKALLYNVQSLLKHWKREEKWKSILDDCIEETPLAIKSVQETLEKINNL